MAVVVLLPLVKLCKPLEVGLNHTLRYNRFFSILELRESVADFHSNPMASRFRGYLPVVVDVETAGFDANKNALLETPKTGME